MDDIEKLIKQVLEQPECKALIDKCNALADEIRGLKRKCKRYELRK